MKSKCNFFFNFELIYTEYFQGPYGYTDELKELYHRSKSKAQVIKKSQENVAESDVEEDCIKIESDVEDKKPKHVIISDDIEEDTNAETTALRRTSDNSDSLIENSLVSDSYLTLSGTIKRGKKKVQNVEVILNMSREELEILEANLAEEEKKFKCKDGSKNGIHILLWSIFCLPFSFIASMVYSFYIGTITWYNIFTLYSERKPLGYRILVPPVLILMYPFFIVTCSVGLGLFAGVRQISWRWDSWRKEFADLEKGFFGWFCNSVDLSECSPYEVVVLSSIRKS